MTAFLISLFLLSWLCQVLYVQFFSFRLAFYAVPSGNTNTPSYPVSVIICARNEAARLDRNLPAILAQEHEQYEVIVVNDASEDDSAEVLQRLSVGHPHLKVVEIAPHEKIHGGKKQALEKGISAAAYELLLLTDADCLPDSSQWITSMTSDLRGNTDIVLGYAPVSRKKGWLNAFLRYDVLSVGVQYLSFALMELPYMGTGRNLAYKKQLTEPSSIKRHFDLLSGDDDLFVNQVTRPGNTVINIRQEARVITEPRESLAAFFRQKRRHFSTGFRYHMKHLLLIGLWNVSKLTLYLSFLLLMLLHPHCMQLQLILMGIYFIFMWISFAGITKRLGDRDLILFIPIMDVISVFFNSFVLATSIFSKNNQWK